MGFVDYIKNVFGRKKQEDDEMVDLKHANLESSDGKGVELDDGDISSEDSEAAARIDKQSPFKTAKDVSKTAEPAAKKITMTCNSCNYKFTRVEDNIPKMCPYCGKDI